MGWKRIWGCPSRLELAQDECIILPLYQEMKIRQLDQVVKVLKSSLK